MANGGMVSITTKGKLKKETVTFTNGTFGSYFEAFKYLEKTGESIQASAAKLIGNFVQLLDRIIWQGYSGP